MSSTFPSFTRRALLALVASSVASVVTAPAMAQSGASDAPLTWIVGFAPGGSVDVMTRLVANKLEAKLGQKVVVENRPGASGMIALQAAASGPADSTLVTVPGPILFQRPVPQIGKELSPVAMLSSGPMILVGTAKVDLPATAKELISDMKAQPSKYSFGSSGNGTSQHLAGELLNQMAGTRMVHIPYKGGGQAVSDLIGGQLPLAILGIPPVLAHVKSGKLRAYGVTTATRSPALPDVPTLQEAGLSGFDASQWFAVAAPANASAAKVQALNAAIGTVLKDPEVVASFARMGLAPDVRTPPQVAQFISAENQRWRELAQKEKLQLD